MRNISILSLLLFISFRFNFCCTPTSDMEDIIKLLKCKVDQVEKVWKDVKNENEILRSTLSNAKIDEKNGEVVIHKPKNGDEFNPFNGIIFEEEEDEKRQPRTQGQVIGSKSGRHTKREVTVDTEQLNAGLIRQNNELKKELKSENSLLKEELKEKSESLRNQLIKKNEELKAEMKRENELFKNELQQENEQLIEQLNVENEQLKADLKNKSLQLKFQMRRENEDLKTALKYENEQLKISLKIENDLLKTALKNESENLKNELKFENNILKEQLERENEELLVQLQEENDQLKMVLKNKSEELKQNLEKEFIHINEKLIRLERKHKMHNNTLVQVRKKMSKLLTYCQMLSPDICGSCNCADDFEQENKYYCDCTNLDTRRDCVEHLKVGHHRNGIYSVDLPNFKSIKVFCDMENGGWIVFQRRMNGKVNFYRDWDAYKIGFGEIEKEFWIGNDNLSSLTTSKLINPKGAELRVDLRDWSNTNVYAVYSKFRVDGEKLNYKLHIGGYSGTAGDSLSYHDNMQFSAPDKDNDVQLHGECSKKNRGPWWHKDCHESNLNGEYLKSNKRNKPSARNVIWYSFKGYKYSLKFVEMKLRRKI